MYHQRDGLYFGRMKDSSVRILKLPKQRANDGFPSADGDHFDAEIDLVIPPYHWASIVASVSAAGEEGERFYQAEKFHAGQTF